MDGEPEPEDLPDRLYTRRQWLMREALINGVAGARGGIVSALMAREAVASVGLEHPEWDMDGEKRTWAGWALEDGWGDL